MAEHPSFVSTAALFAGERWNALQVGGVSLGSLLLLCAAGVGAALFLRDAAPPLVDVLRAERVPVAPPAPVPDTLAHLVVALTPAPWGSTCRR